MRTIRFVFIGAVALLSLFASAWGEIKDGKVIYRGKVYGVLLDDRFYELALRDYMSESNITAQTLRAQFNFVGRCYCWKKRNAPDAAKRNKDGFILDSTQACRQEHTQLDTDTGILMMTYVVAKIAEETLCVDDYSNPIETEPPKPPQLRPADLAK